MYLAYKFKTATCTVLRGRHNDDHSNYESFVIFDEQVVQKRSTNVIGSKLLGLTYN